jgi:hypothetical protein
VTREHGRAHSVTARIRGLVRAIEQNDPAQIEEAVLRLSRSRRALAPLAFMVGAVALLFDGLRLLVTHWRLTLVQILPAMWIWLVTFDLKVHVIHGHDFNVIRGPILIPIILLIAAITAAAFFLNAVFGLAVARPGEPDIRAARDEAWRRRTPILVWGSIVGLALGFATMVVTRWGRPWFGICLSIVLGVLMLCYVLVPSRLIGNKPHQSRRDKLLTTTLGGLLSATVCTPPYILGRIGLLMLGTKWLLIPAIVVLAVAATLQAGATGAVRAIKMSAALVGTREETETTAVASGAEESEVPAASGRGG